MDKIITPISDDLMGLVMGENDSGACLSTPNLTARGNHLLNIKVTNAASKVTFLNSYFQSVFTSYVPVVQI